MFSTYESTLAAASENFGLPFLPLFAIAAGASPLEVSLVSAVPNFVANALQLPFGRLAERTGRRKALWLAGNSVVRFVWIPVAILPWLIRDRRALILSLIALTAVRGLASAVAVPGWTALMADLTRRSWRGAYFAVRSILANVVALAATVIAGWLVGRWGYPTGYALVFGAAWLMGASSLLAILPIHEPSRVRMARGAPSPSSGEGAPAATSPAAGIGAHHPARRSLFPADWFAGGPRNWKVEAPGFYEWAVSAFLWNAAVNLPAGLFPVMFAQVLRGTPELWGITNGVTFLTTILSQRYWGRLSDRIGQRPVMVGSGVWAAMLPLWWALIPSPEWIIAINVVGGVAWAGFNLAAFNLLLEVTPDARRPSYVAVFNLGVGIASSVAPILGAAASEWIGIHAVMVVSWAMRLGSLLLYARLARTPVRWVPEVDARRLLPWRAGRTDLPRARRPSAH